MHDTEGRLWRGAILAACGVVALVGTVAIAGIVVVTEDESEHRDVQPLDGTPVERTKSLTVDATANVEVRYSASMRHLLARCLNTSTGVALFVVESDATNTTAGVGPYCDTCAGGATLPPLGTAYLRTSAGTATVRCGFVEDWPTAGINFTAPGGSGSGGTLNGTGTTPEVALWSGAAALAGNAGFTFTDAAGLVGNEAGGLTQDLRWETDNEASAFFVDASTDTVNINGGSAFNGGWTFTRGLNGALSATGLTTIIKGGDGDASAPGYSFGNDGNTGMLRAAADTLAWATGGIARSTLSTVAQTFTVPVTVQSAFPQLRGDSTAGTSTGALFYEGATLRGGFAYDAISTGHPRTVMSFYGANAATAGGVIHLDTQGDAVFTRNVPNARSLIFSGPDGSLSGNVEAGATADLVWHGDTLASLLFVDASTDQVLTGNHVPLTADTYTLGTFASQWDRIFADDGTAALPAIAVGNNDLGFYKIGTDTMGFSTAGAFRAGLSSSGLGLAVPITNALSQTVVSMANDTRFFCKAGTVTAPCLSTDVVGSENTGINVASVADRVDIVADGADVVNVGVGGMSGTQATTGTPQTWRPPTAIAATLITLPTCAAAVDAGKIFYVDDSDDANAGALCTCRANSAGTYANVLVSDNVTACPDP